MRRCVCKNFRRSRLLYRENERIFFGVAIDYCDEMRAAGWNPATLGVETDSEMRCQPQFYYVSALRVNPTHFLTSILRFPAFAPKKLTKSRERAERTSSHPGPGSVVSGNPGLVLLDSPKN